MGGVYYFLASVLATYFFIPLELRRVIVTLTELPFHVCRRANLVFPFMLIKKTSLQQGTPGDLVTCILNAEFQWVCV